MYQYLITEEQLREMVQYGQEHPDEEFYIEPLNDGSEIEDEFLSCSFWSYETDDNPADRTTGIWELSYGKGDDCQMCLKKT